MIVDDIATAFHYVLFKMEIFDWTFAVSLYLLTWPYWLPLGFHDFHGCLISELFLFLEFLFPRGFIFTFE